MLVVCSFIPACSSRALIKRLWGKTPFSVARSAEEQLPASLARLRCVGVFDHTPPSQQGQPVGPEVNIQEFALSLRKAWRCGEF